MRVREKGFTRGFPLCVIPSCLVSLVRSLFPSRALRVSLALACAFMSSSLSLSLSRSSCSICFAGERGNHLSISLSFFLS